MKRLFLVALGALPLMVTGQTLLYSDGAIIKVQPGATLYVEGGIHNTLTGTIDNDGTIEVRGNLINEGIWEASQANTLKFSGDINSQVSPGSAVFHNVIVAKESGFHVNLAMQGTASGHMTISNNLSFDNMKFGKIVTGNYDVKLQSGATVSTPDADQYVATTGTGMMEKAVTANGSFTFPIGDVDNYSPLASTYTGSAYAAANIRTKANDLVHPNKPADATEFITRYWDVNATGITGYDNTLTGTYVPADLTLGAGGLASQVKGAVHDGAEWSYLDAASGANIVIGSTEDGTADFTGTNFFGKASLKVFLAGALPITGLPPMTTALNTPTQLIPLASPYSVTPWFAPAVTAPSIPASTTDWILVETRDPSINIISQTSAFLKSDGTIVGIDGGQLLLKNAIPSAIISIRHRNHLGVRTIGPLDLTASPATSHDFSTGTGQAWTNPALPPPATNANMRLMGPTYCLWGGNANISNAVALTRITYIGAANDPQGILNAMGGNSGVPVLGVYNNADVNLNRNITFIGAQNDPQVVLQNMSGNSGIPVIQHLQ